MSIATSQRMTLEDYLTCNPGTESRYEPVDGVLVEMGNESKLNIKIAKLNSPTFPRFNLSTEYVTKAGK